MSRDGFTRDNVSHVYTQDKIGNLLKKNIYPNENKILAPFKFIDDSKIYYTFLIWNKWYILFYTTLFSGLEPMLENLTNIKIIREYVKY